MLSNEGIVVDCFCCWSRFLSMRSFTNTFGSSGSGNMVKLYLLAVRGLISFLNTLCLVVEDFSKFFLAYCVQIVCVECFVLVVVYCVLELLFESTFSMSMCMFTVHCSA
jgi:hypothetical protein